MAQLSCLIAHTSADPSDESDLATRVQAEFREMPGLNLTLPQAVRLFSLEPARCERVLRTLVGIGLLATDGRTFVRADGGRRCA
jgi:hypothetical protein